MIKGIFLSKLPEMDKISDAEIMGQIDPLELDSDPQEYKGSYEMTKCEFYNEEFHIISFTSENSDGRDGLFRVLSAIQKGAPAFSKVFKYSPKVIIFSYPRWLNDEDDEKYEQFIDELLRLSAFLFRQFNIMDEDIPGMIKDYIDMAIYYPGKKQ